MCLSKTKSGIEIESENFCIRNGLSFRVCGRCNGKVRGTGALDVAHGICKRCLNSVYKDRNHAA